MRYRITLIFMLALFVSVQLCAMFLSTFYPSDMGAFENQDDPLNPLIYVVMVLIMTALVLVMLKLGLQKVIKAIFLFAVAITSVFVLLPLIYQIYPNGDVAVLVSLLIGIALALALLLRPEWYVINLVGFIVGVGAAVVLGISLGILPVLILLILLGVYDAISVYRTKHMIRLAEGMVPLRLPIMFVVPKDKDFTLDGLSTKPLTEVSPEERGAMFMGVGDAVIPSILSVAVLLTLPSTSHSFQNANLIVALGTLLGSVVGFLILMGYVAKGKPQAGLPLLNGGAILGFLITYMLVFRDFNFGIVV
ncbi:MAG: presenilin family intramembrane aspartyl protease PSH [Methanomassiliicoccales archaeon]